MKTATLFLAMMALGVMSLGAAAKPEEIQKAARLPKLTVKFDFNVNLSIGFDGIKQIDEPELPVKIKFAEELAATEEQQRKNPEYLLKLARAWKEAEAKEKTKATYAKLLEVLSGLDGNNPEHKQMKMEAADALGDQDQTEKLARELVAANPANAEAWFTLGDSHFYRARQLVVPGTGKSDTEEILTGVLNLPKERMAKLAELLEEARASYNRGLETVPGQLNHHISKAFVMLMSDILKAHANGGPTSFDVSAYLVKNLKESEMKQIAAAHQDNALVLAWLGYAWIVRCLAETPDATAAVVRIREMARDPNLIPRLEHFLAKGSQAEAETAGKVLMVFAIQTKEHKKGAGYMKRLTMLVPADESYWRGYLNFLEYAGEHELLIQEAKAAMRIKEDAWTHLKMARAYEQLQKQEEVAEEIELATRLDAEDKLVKLFACFWVIKNSDPTGDDFSNYGGILAQLDQTSDGDNNWTASIAYTRGFYYALRGITVLAQQQLERAKAVRPGNDDVARLRELLK